MISKHAGKNGSTRGFTLLEVLVSILMVSLVMTTTYAVLYTTLGARDHIQKENLESKIGPAILNLVENSTYAPAVVLKLSALF